MLRRFLIIMFVLICVMVSSAFAEEYVSIEKYKQLEDRVSALEKKLGEYDKCMNEQKQCILDQNKKIAQYESRLGQFDTELHRQTGTPISIAEGLEIGAGGTIKWSGLSRPVFSLVKMNRFWR